MRIVDIRECLCWVQHSNANRVYIWIFWYEKGIWSEEVEQWKWTWSDGKGKRSTKSTHFFQSGDIEYISGSNVEVINISNMLYYTYIACSLMLSLMYPKYTFCKHRLGLLHRIIYRNSLLTWRNGFSFRFLFCVRANFNVSNVCSFLLFFGCSFTLFDGMEFKYMRNIYFRCKFKGF